MRKIFLRIAAVTALVLGGWAAYGAAGPSDLAAVSDREATQAVGGQGGSCTNQNCVWISATTQCTGNPWVDAKFKTEPCPNGTFYGQGPSCGANAVPQVGHTCVTACGGVCTGVTNRQPGNCF